MVNYNASPQEQRDLATEQFDSEVKRGANPDILLADGYTNPIDLYSLGQNREDQAEAPTTEENIYTGSGISESEEARIIERFEGGEVSRDQAEDQILGIARATEIRARRAAARGAHAGEVHAAKGQSTQRLQGYSAPQETEQSQSS